MEEVLPQYEFAERFHINGTACCTSPAPFGGTLPKGEGLFLLTKLQFVYIKLTISQKSRRKGGGSQVLGN